jgi:hypothetical protein
VSLSIPCDGTGRRVLAAVADTDPRLTDTDIGRWCGVDRSLVVHWRGGDRSMPVWAVRRIAARLTPRQAAVVLAELAPAGVEVVEETPAAGAGIMVDAARCADAATTLARLVAEAQADGRITQDEAAGIHKAIGRVDELAATARASLRVAR